MVFRRVLVGFDGSPASVRTLAATRALCAGDATLTALTVAETYYASHAGMDAVAWDEKIREDAERVRSEAAGLLEDMPGATAELASGHAGPTLLRMADKLGADLIAVGSHGHGRMSGMLLGSVATRVVHDARCSVLVARGSEPLDGFPGSIVVAVDATPPSREAARVAAAIAGSARADLRQLDRRPVDGLVEASRSADLLVVGSRGLQGLSSVRSVAERVAHEAACPVLIVREKSATSSPRTATATGATQL